MTKEASPQVTFDEYQDKAASTRMKFDHPKDGLQYLTIGLAGEVGEVCEHVKKFCFHDKAYDSREMIKELGDVLWYLTNLADVMGVDLATVAEMNLAKLKARHPAGWSPKYADRDGVEL